jgi:hypothetical protein
MKKKQTIKAFYFKDEDILNGLDRELPIDIKRLHPLIERIYKRYPLIDKTEVVIIVKTAFQAIRELLVSGAILNFQKFMFDVKLHFFGSPRRPAVKIKLKTPPPIKELK